MLLWGEQGKGALLAGGSPKMTKKWPPGQ